MLDSRVACISIVVLAKQPVISVNSLHARPPLRVRPTRAVSIVSVVRQRSDVQIR